ncbi:MAG TPA: hypothetical protein VFZ21_32430 [Gemmatimonadaceae bacterium]|nr:hypothetical protein [Gemmatimonadaceae bacterium]
MRQRFLTWALLVVIVFVAANHLLWRGRGVAMWDASNQAFPYFVLVADHARAGQLVQWDPWTEAGLPIGGEPQAGAYSPLVVALGLLGGGNSTTFLAYWLLSWLVGGIGVLALGRHLGAPPWGACAVALGFLFCGVYTGNAQHISWVVGLSFIPLVLWRLDVALLTRSARAAVQAGALWGLGALAAHPSIIILCGAYTALWTLGRVLFGGARGDAAGSPNASDDAAAESVGAAAVARPPSARFALRALGLLCAVGVVVLAPTYASTLRDGTGVHSRSGPLAKSDAVTNEFPPGGLVTIASAYPSRVKFYLPDELWPQSDVSMVSVYAGVLVPVLALFALVAPVRDRWRWWVAGLATLSLACAMGTSLPLHGWLYDWVYPIRFFRHSAVFRLFYVISVVVLALLGTRELAVALARGERRRRRQFAAVAFGSAFAAAIAYAFFLVGIRDLPSNRLAPAFIAAWLGPVALGVLLLGNRLPSRVAATGLVLVAVGDALATSVLTQRTIVDTEGVAKWRELDRRHETSLDLAPLALERVVASCEDWDPTQWCEVNDQMITKTPVQHAYSAFKNRIYTLFLHDSTLAGAARGRDRLWFSAAVTEIPRSDSTAAAYVRMAREVGALVPVVHRRDEMLAPPASGASDPGARAAVAARLRALPAARRVSATVLDYRPNDLALAVTAPEDGWLFVTDRWGPAWRATVNGKRVELMGGAFLYRAVPVSAGANTVRFTYRAAGFPFLVIASGGTLGLVLLASVGRRPVRPDAGVLRVSAA